MSAEPRTINMDLGCLLYISLGCCIGCVFRCFSTHIFVYNTKGSFMSVSSYRKQIWHLGGTPSVPQCQYPLSLPTLNSAFMIQVPSTRSSGRMYEGVHRFHLCNATPVCYV
jgi:hypothetical protein